MISEGRFQIPEQIQGVGSPERIAEHLCGVTADLVERVEAELGPEFEVRAQAPQHDFGGYCAWQIGVHRAGQLEATVCIEWSADLDPGSFSIHWEDAQPRPAGRLAAMAASALLGLALGATLSWDGALAGLVLGAPLGALAQGAWVRLPRLRAASPPLVRPVDPFQLGA